MMHGISSGDLKMKLSETPFLSKEALLARITPSSLDFTKWKKRGEVIVRAQDDSVLLRQDERIVELELVPESGPLENYASSAETLWELASLKPNAAYLRFVLAQHVIDNFNISFMVDTRTAESMQLMGVVGSSDVQDAMNWLRDEFLCEIPGSANLRVFMPMRERPDDRHFQLFGRKHVLELSKDGAGVMWVDQVSARGINTDMALVIADGNIRFLCSVETAPEASPESAVRLEIVTSTFGTYLDLWKTYGEREWQRTVMRAARIQAVAYTNCKPLSEEGGGWRLSGDPESMRGMEQRWRELAEEDDQMEVFDHAPDWQSDRYTDLGSKDAKTRLRGKPIWRDGQLTLEVRSHDEPPASGFIYLSVTGDRTQQARRMKARQFIESGRGVPSLRALLQDQPTPTARASKLPALTASARESFRSGKPTATQEEAIRVALNTPDVALIIGPPGTGKTQVIAALERRLSEMNEGKSIAQDVLISSFQHDAVENALERTEVFGLPAVKIGSGRSQSGLDGVDAWRDRKRLQVEKRLEDLIATSPSQRILQELGNLLNGMLVQGVPEERRTDRFARVTELVNELGSVARIRVPSTWIDRWEDAIEFSATNRSPSVGFNLDGGRKRTLRRVVRSMRLTSEGAADDGRERLVEIRSRLGAHDGILDESDRRLLEDACLATEMTALMLQSLAILQARILDRLTTDVRTQEERNHLPELVIALLRELRQFLNDKVATSSHGLAGVIERYADALAWNKNRVRTAVEQYSSIVGATCQQSASRQMALLKGGSEEGLDTLRFTSVIIDEAARANPLDLFIPMALAKRRIILVGDPRQLPHLLDEDIEEEIRAERGDQVQRDTYRKSLFERLSKQFQKRETSDGFSRVVMLDIQFRMHPRLGDFVSQQFYESAGLGRVKSGLKETDFLDEVPGLGRAVCGWIDLPYDDGKEERKDSSRRRRVEAERVAKEIARLMLVLPQKMSVGVITFYAAQRDAIFDALAKHSITERTQLGWGVSPAYASNEECPERLRIGTIDSFQGKEFDVVLLSTVRSNRNKIPTLPNENDPEEIERFEKEASGKFGHLRSANRLNVAMSRQRRFLLAIGDAEMYRGASAVRAVPEMNAFLELCESEAIRVA